MVKSATKFTPEILLGSPRRSTGRPSPCGKYVLHSVSTHDFREHKTVSEIRVLEHGKGLSHLIIGGGEATEAHWLPNNDILYLKPDQSTGHVDFVTTGLDAKDHKVIASSEHPIQDLKLKFTDKGRILVLAWGSADAGGNLVNEKKVPKPLHSSRLYDTVFVRHWDTWKGKLHNALFFTQLEQSATNDEGTWSIGEWTGVHKGERLESPIAPFPSADNYDISEYGITFVAKDPVLNPALHTTCHCYFVPLTVQGDRYAVSKSRPRKIETRGFEGAASSPVFSPDGKSIAFLKMRADKYESDRNNVIVASNIVEASAASEPARAVEIKKDDWDISPNSICFGHESSSLFMKADFNGQSRLWWLELSTGTVEPMTRHGSVLDVKPLSNPPRMFVSGSSYVDDSFYGILWPDSPRNLDVISSHSRDGQLYGLDPGQSTSFWYPGHASTVQSLMVLPSGFDWENKTKKYPLAMLIHGGPQAAWLDEWSTRWNPAVWAEQGYVTIMPNITGSTGYGQAFVDAITQDWGGAPYLDIVKCMEHIKDHMPFVDLDRAIAAGASYGGYMMNWIQGHDLGRNFKAIICHDGIFNNVGAQLASEEIYFGEHDLGGWPWDRDGKGIEEWQRWDPSAFTQNWATPQLIIHNEKDFRLTIAEGLGAFNVLQAKKIPSRLLVGENENHWTLNPENSLVWHTVVLNWANKYVGLPPYKDDESQIIEPNEQWPTR